jgi:hypothetical protein
MLLLFGNTPAEAIHAFAHHKDTVHRSVDGQFVDAQHHHCQFLGFQMMPFDAPPALPKLCPAPLPDYVVFLAVQDERATQQIIALREGRGPPVS